MGSLKSQHPGHPHAYKAHTAHCTDVASPGIMQGGICSQRPCASQLSSCTHMHRQVLIADQTGPACSAACTAQVAAEPQCTTHVYAASHPHCQIKQQAPAKAARLLPSSTLHPVVPTAAWACATERALRFKYYIQRGSGFAAQTKQQP
jgi:hypothetical protein